MATSLFLAKPIGPVRLVIGLALPISTGIYLVFGALLTFFGYRH